MLEYDLIETPENVELEQRLAGIGTRLIAGVLDHLLILGLYIVLGLLLFGIAGINLLADVDTLPLLLVAVLIVVAFAIYWGYFAFFEMVWNGQSPGKRRMRIRVVKQGGAALTFTDVAIRNLLRVVDAMPVVIYAVAGLSMFFSRIIFGLGILGMALSSITMHMLICGFAACEIFGVEPGGWRYRLACLIPAPAGVAGVVLWPYIGSWIAIPTSAICGLMLPIAFIAFFILNNSKRYLGEHKPTGKKALAWNTAMVVSISATMASIIYYLASRL